MRCFARNLGSGMLAILTFFLTCAAAEGVAIDGWALYGFATLAYASIVCLYYGFGEFDE